MPNVAVAAPPAAARPAASGGEETPASWRARGKAFSKGEGAARNPAQALFWTRKAAEAGDAGAQYDLSTYYYQGINGLPKNLPESVKWFRMVAEQGDPDGQTDYGTRLWWGEGVSVNHAEAVRWFRKAAAQNHADGQFWLGNAYRRGLGVEFDIAQARYWLGKARAQGHENAPGMLAFMDQVDREFAQRAPVAQRDRPEGNSLWKQYSQTMERQRRENCEAAAQGRNRACDKW